MANKQDCGCGRGKVRNVIDEYSGKRRMDDCIAEEELLIVNQVSVRVKSLKM